MANWIGRLFSLSNFFGTSSPSSSEEKNEKRIIRICAKKKKGPHTTLTCWKMDRQKCKGIFLLKVKEEEATAAAAASLQMSSLSCNNNPHVPWGESQIIHNYRLVPSSSSSSPWHWMTQLKMRLWSIKKQGHSQVLLLRSLASHLLQKLLLLFCCVYQNAESPPKSTSRLSFQIAVKKKNLSKLWIDPKEHKAFFRISKHYKKTKPKWQH